MAEVTLSPKPMPTHIAIVASSTTPETTVKTVLELLSLIVGLKIPMLTLHFSNKDDVDSIETLFTALLHEKMLDQNQVKVGVLGKWYELPDRALEPIKHLISSTSDYDRHFINICVKYDGQEDVVDGAKLLAKHVQLGKIVPEQINKATLKEAMLTSTLLPPELIIIPGPGKRMGDILLWDSPSSLVHFSDTAWKDFGKEAFINSLSFYQKHHGKN